MALPILDGNQSATTLSTILSSGQHITAHTVVSLGTQAITDIVNATSSGLTNTQLRASAVTVGGTVTVGNSLTISSLPAISGTVTANTRNNGISNDPWVYIPRLTMSHPDTGNFVFDGYYRFNGENQWGSPNLNSGNCAYLTRFVQSDSYFFNLMVHDENNDQEITFAQWDSGQTTDFPTSMGAISGTLVSGSLTFNTEQRESYGVRVANSVTVGNSVTIGSIPNGALTTRFGSITTANTALATTAVTNTSRKYLMIQNIASTVITIGIGFAPTTTQGIQLSAGATITFDNNYIPTGWVRILSAVTSSNFTVLEA